MQRTVKPLRVTPAKPGAYHFLVNGIQPDNGIQDFQGPGLPFLHGMDNLVGNVEKAKEKRRQEWLLNNQKLTTFSC